MDWSRPRFGILGPSGSPSWFFGENNKDNWNNTYRRLCEAEGWSSSATTISAQ